jgi:hypothetical protein
LLSISAVLPGFPTPQNRAPWPVWRGSVAGPVRFAAMSRKAVAKYWHALRRWDRETRGAIGHVARDVYYALAFDFLNYETGRLDPSLDQLAEHTGWCRRSVGTALARLRDLGLLAWQRRCEETRDAKGRFRLRQQTNAYAVLPPSQWHGYRERPEPPPPHPATLGAPERVPDPIGAAVVELTHGQRMASLAALEADPRDALATALAAFGRAIDEREAGTLIGMQLPPSNPTRDSNNSDSDRFAAAKPAPTELEAAKQHWLRVLLGPGGSG